MRDGVKVPSGGRAVARDRPGLHGRLWGYNGQSRGPPSRWWKATACASSSPTACLSATSIHWHGQRLPNGMDGVGGPDPAAIGRARPLSTSSARRPGTFMYHPHADEMAQMAMGMMGMWITHPARPTRDRRGRPRLLLPAERVRHRARRQHAAHHDHDRLQHLVVEQPRLPGIDS